MRLAAAYLALMAFVIRAVTVVCQCHGQEETVFNFHNAGCDFSLFLLWRRCVVHHQLHTGVKGDHL